MDVALLFNPRSGRGRGARAAEALTRALAAGGHRVAVLESGEAADRDLPGLLTGSGALVIVGGDGTLHHAAPAAIAAGTPVYQVPMGTENLFARQFGMNRRPGTLLRALAQRRIVHADIGRVNGREFVLMCSVGVDASVVHRMAYARTGSIGHWSYIRPLLAEVYSPALSPLTIIVDGEPIVHERPGLVIIGNSRQYAMRVDPALHASMTDGLLDVVFFPARTRVRLIGWALASRLRRHVHRRALVYRTGRTISIESGAGPLPYQLDREAPAPQGPRTDGACGNTTPLSITTEPGALQVLCARPQRH